MSYEACAARDRGGQRRRQDDLRRRDHAAARPDQVATVCTDDYRRYDRAQRKELDITPLDPACNYLDVLAQHLRLLGAGRELSVEGPEILRRAAMGSPELGAALDVWRETTFDFEAVDHLDRSEARS